MLFHRRPPRNAVGLTVMNIINHSHLISGSKPITAVDINSQLRPMDNNTNLEEIINTH